MIQYRNIGRRPIERLEQRTLLTVVIDVNTTADSDSGSLRDAINEANAYERSIIVFDLPAGVQTIKPQTPLPSITQRVDIIGATDAAGNPLVVIDGDDAGAGADGLTFDRNTPGDSTPSTVSGLVIEHFNGSGIDIQGAGDTQVFGCRIGTDSTGKRARGNGNGVLVEAPGVQIGSPGVGPTYQNVISGNTNVGVVISTTVTGTLIQNNFIGVDVTGKKALGNAGSGVFVADESNPTIGGDRPLEGNVISANGGWGIEIFGNGTTVQGNFIGTNAAGTAALGNADGGIFLDSVQNTLVGNDPNDTGARNIISGNGGDGISFDASSNNTIQDDYIGTDVTGTVAIGNALWGVVIDGNSNSIFNCVVSGNGAGGVEIANLSGTSTNNNIQECLIGTDVTGTLPIGNIGDGVLIKNAGHNAVNYGTIAFNQKNGDAGFGVDIQGDTAVHNYVEANIFSNARLGINLGDNGGAPLPNHGNTAAMGPDDLQNYPVLTSAVYSAGIITIKGTLVGLPDTSYFVNFFVSDKADPSGFGQGQTFFEGSSFTTDASGNVAITSNDSNNQQFGPGDVFTATASFQSGAEIDDTSEFSNALKIDIPGATVSGTVFDDANGDGKQDDGEKGLAGRRVYVDMDGIGTDEGDEVNQQFVTTDSNGDYNLYGVPPGKSVLIRQGNVVGWTAVNPGPGANFYSVRLKATTHVTGANFADQQVAAGSAPTLAVDVAASEGSVTNAGVDFAEDPDFGTETRFTSPFAVNGTDDDPLFYTYRAGTQFDYSFPVTNGKYILKLYFVEPTKTAAGQRVFSVAAQGKTVLKNLDIFAAVGADTALIKSIPVTVANGTLSLKFTGVVDQAIVSAIALIPA